ncbi:MAG: toprim domain-containing protein [Solirubrobacteraceae bacterium]
MASSHGHRARYAPSIAVYATLQHLGIGWDGRRLTIPIRGGDGELHGVLRYAPTATRTAKMIAMPGTRLGLIPHPTTEPSQWIILTEGPPDMITARTRGLPALAVPGDHAWDARWASTLEDRDVTIVMDADRAGRVAARRIERDLTGVARTVTIAELDPDRQDGYDFTDWLDAHRGLPTSTVRSLLLPDLPPNACAAAGVQ